MSNEKPGRSYDVTVILVGKDVFLVRQAEAFKVNKVGMFIWNHLEGDAAVPEIASKMVESFDIDIVTATQDVEDFVAELKRRQLVEVL